MNINSYINKKDKIKDIFDLYININEKNEKIENDEIPEKNEITPKKEILKKMKLLEKKKMNYLQNIW